MVSECNCESLSVAIQLCSILAHAQHHTGAKLGEFVKDYQMPKGLLKNACDVVPNELQHLDLEFFLEKVRAESAHALDTDDLNERIKALLEMHF